MPQPLAEARSVQACTHVTRLQRHAYMHKQDIHANSRSIALVALLQRSMACGADAPALRRVAPGCLLTHASHAWTLRGGSRDRCAWLECSSIWLSSFTCVDAGSRVADRILVPLRWRGTNCRLFKAQARAFRRSDTPSVTISLRHQLPKRLYNRFERAALRTIGRTGIALTDPAGGRSLLVPSSLTSKAVRSETLLRRSVCIPDGQLASAGEC